VFSKIGEKIKERKWVKKKGKEKKIICVFEREGKEYKHFFHVLKQERKKRKYVVFTNIPFKI